jgi:hypothetical protein
LKFGSYAWSFRGKITGRGPMIENPECGNHWVAGFRVRLRFASAPRNDEVGAQSHMIDFMESLY